MTHDTPRQSREEPGMKYDHGKIPWHLLPFDALGGIANVLDFGQEKYSARNWEAGMSWSRCFRACCNHLFKWFLGHKGDEETGMSHLWHAGCCILFLIAWEMRQVGTDDRPRSGMLIIPDPMSDDLREYARNLGGK